MPTDVIMPQMGESIFEGTITKWLKKPGDKVQRDEPLFEISTDKVDAEIPAPASGVLQEIKIAEGATVQVNTVVGTISEDGAGAQPAPAKAAPAPPPAKATNAKPLPPVVEQKPPAPPLPGPDDEHLRSSPLVRKIAREHNINLSKATALQLLPPPRLRFPRLRQPQGLLRPLPRPRSPATSCP
jgi:pyruvate dehydrogenase E2 component (dihydrolipoamide acetyltransferase)